MVGFKVRGRGRKSKMEVKNEKGENKIEDVYKINQSGRKEICCDRNWKLEI